MENCTMEEQCISNSEPSSEDSIGRDAPNA
jgi:hypothetical protein